MHLGKFPDSLEFQSWKVNFKTEVCAKSAFLHITIQWIKEVEIAKPIDDLMTSQSITGRTDFPDDDMLDVKIVSAVKKIISSVHFRKRRKWSWNVKTSQKCRILFSFRLCWLSTTKKVIETTINRIEDISKTSY